MLLDHALDPPVATLGATSDGAAGEWFASTIGAPKAAALVDAPDHDLITHQQQLQHERGFLRGAPSPGPTGHFGERCGACKGLVVVANGRVVVLVPLDPEGFVLRAAEGAQSRVRIRVEANGAGGMPLLRDAAEDTYGAAGSEHREMVPPTPAVRRGRREIAPCRSPFSSVDRWIRRTLRLGMLQGANMQLSAHVVRDARRRVIENANRQVFADDATFNEERARRLEELIDEGMRLLEVNLVNAGITAMRIA